jgi:hypothetical protein
LRYGIYNRFPADIFLGVLYGRGADCDYGAGGEKIGGIFQEIFMVPGDIAVFTDIVLLGIGHIQRPEHDGNGDIHGGERGGGVIAFFYYFRLRGERGGRGILVDIQDVQEGKEDVEVRYKLKNQISKVKTTNQK